MSRDFAYKQLLKFHLFYAINVYKLNLPEKIFQDLLIAVSFLCHLIRGGLTHSYTVSVSPAFQGDPIRILALDLEVGTGK